MLLLTAVIVSGCSKLEEVKAEAQVSEEITEYLRRKRAYMDTGPDFTQLLKSALIDSNIEVVKYLVENGADVNYNDSEYNSAPLVLAIDSGNLDLVKFLVENGANVNIELEEYNFSGYRNFTHLMYAIDQGYTEIAKYLIEKGAKSVVHERHISNSAQNRYITPLMYAFNEGYMDVVQLLVEHGAIHYRFEGNNTELIYACRDRYKDTDLIQLLVENGAEINAINDEGSSALLEWFNFFNYNKNTDSVYYLLDHGADITIANYEGSVLHRLRYADDTMFFDFAERFIASGGDLEAQDRFGQTIFTQSLTDIERLTFLGGKGVNVHHINNDGTNAFSGIAYDLPPHWREQIEPYIIGLGVEQVRYHGLGRVYNTTDNLRIRASEGITGKPLVTVVKDTPLLVQQRGSLETIDGIKNFWLEVEVAEDSKDTKGNTVPKGTTGWIFAGYIRMDSTEGYVNYPIRRSNSEEGIRYEVVKESALRAG